MEVEPGSAKTPLKLQLKRRAKLPAYLQVPEQCDAVVFRQDHGESLVLVRARDVWGKRDD